MNTATVHDAGVIDAITITRADLKDMVEEYAHQSRTPVDEVLDDITANPEDYKIELSFSERSFTKNPVVSAGFVRSDLHAGENVDIEDVNVFMHMKNAYSRGGVSLEVSATLNFVASDELALEYSVLDDPDADAYAPDDED